MDLSEILKDLSPKESKLTGVSCLLSQSEIEAFDAICKELKQRRSAVLKSLIKEFIKSYYSKAK